MAHTAYGPAARPGVTTLMSVGDELQVEASPIERYLDRVSVVGVVVALAGWLAGSRTLRDAGLGAYVGARLTKHLARR